MPGLSLFSSPNSFSIYTSGVRPAHLRLFHFAGCCPCGDFTLGGAPRKFIVFHLWHLHLFEIDDHIVPGWHDRRIDDHIVLVFFSD